MKLQEYFVDLLSSKRILTLMAGVLGTACSSWAQGNNVTSSFVQVMPCRLVDTRNAVGGPFGAPTLSANETRTFPLATSSSCILPDKVSAYSLNVTVIPKTTLAYLTIWPTGSSQPVVSTLNSPTGQIIANAALVPAGTSGSVNVYVHDATDVIIDIDGYFIPQTNISSGKQHGI